MFLFFQSSFKHSLEYSLFDYKAWTSLFLFVSRISSNRKRHVPTTQLKSPYQTLGPLLSIHQTTSHFIPLLGLSRKKSPSRISSTVRERELAQNSLPYFGSYSYEGTPTQARLMYVKHNKPGWIKVFSRAIIPVWNVESLSGSFYYFRICNGFSKAPLHNRFSYHMSVLSLVRSLSLSYMALYEIVIGPISTPDAVNHVHIGEQVWQ